MLLALNFSNLFYLPLLRRFIYLRLIGAGLSREVDESWNKQVLVDTIHEFVLDVH